MVRKSIIVTLRISMFNDQGQSNNLYIQNKYLPTHNINIYTGQVKNNFTSSADVLTTLS